MKEFTFVGGRIDVIVGCEDHLWVQVVEDESDHGKDDGWEETQQEEIISDLKTLSKSLSVCSLYLVSYDVSIKDKYFDDSDHFQVV